MPHNDGDSILTDTIEERSHAERGDPYSSPASFWSSTGGKIQIALDALLVLLAILNLYWIASARNTFQETAQTQSDQLKLLARRMDSSDERYARLSSELNVTTERLGLTSAELTRARAMAAAIKKQEQQSVQQLNQAIAQKAGADELNKLQADANTKFDSLSGDIAKTNEALTGTKGELSGAIARTHDELVALAHKTDRDYFEFTLPRKGEREKVGNVGVQLLKTNLKKNQYSVYLYFDDQRVLQKDKGIMEPVFFYVQGAPNALELVVNHLGKDKISGYLSAPKGLYANVPNVLSERPKS